MTTSIFGSGVSALNSAQMGLATAEHNISNMNTPGFTRQQTVQAARPPQYAGSAGYIGQGVEVSTVKRAYNDFLGKQILQEQGLSSQLDSHYTQIKQIDNMLADPNSGMAPSIQEFFSSVNNASNAPESQPARQALVSSANAMSSRFQSVNQRLIDLNAGVNTQITNSVTNINSYAKQISALNKTIVIAEGANHQSPNDLLDQRDELVTQLNHEIKTTVVKQSDGSFSLFIGNGQSLVVGSAVFELKTVQSPSDVTKVDVSYINSNGVAAAIQQSNLQGGALGGLLEFRDKTLVNTQNSLGRVAMGIAGTFNEQHKRGQDLNGDLGVDFFSKPVPLVMNNTINKGNATLSASVNAAEDYTALTGSDYELRYNGGTSYTLTRLNDKQIMSFSEGLPGSPVDGLTLQMSAGAEAGDKFLIRPTWNGARDLTPAISDPAKVALAMPVRSNASTRNLGTGKMSEATVDARPSLSSDPLHPTTADCLQEPVVICFNDPPTTYNVVGNGTDNAINIPYRPGRDISYNGWTMQISGSPEPGDVFTVGSNPNATADGRNGLLLAGLQTANTMAGGTTSYQGAYSQIVSDIGNKTRELEVTSKAQASMVEQTLQTKDTLSGVNMDEEAANLLRYQRAYQAAGKALQIANTMFDTILNLQR